MSNARSRTLLRSYWHTLPKKEKKIETPLKTGVRRLKGTPKSHDFSFSIHQFKIYNSFANIFAPLLPSNTFLGIVISHIIKENE